MTLVGTSAGGGESGRGGRQTPEAEASGGGGESGRGCHSPSDEDEEEHSVGGAFGTGRVGGRAGTGVGVFGTAWASNAGGVAGSAFIGVFGAGSAFVSA